MPPSPAPDIRTPDPTLEEIRRSSARAWEEYAVVTHDCRERVREQVAERGGVSRLAATDFRALLDRDPELALELAAGCQELSPKQARKLYRTIVEALRENPAFAGLSSTERRDLPNKIPLGDMFGIAVASDPASAFDIVKPFCEDAAEVPRLARSACRKAFMQNPGILPALMRSLPARMARTFARGIAFDKEEVVIDERLPGPVAIALYRDAAGLFLDEEFARRRIGRLDSLISMVDYALHNFNDLGTLERAWDCFTEIRERGITPSLFRGTRFDVIPACVTRLLCTGLVDPASRMGREMVEYARTAPQSSKTTQRHVTYNHVIRTPDGRDLDSEQILELNTPCAADIETLGGFLESRGISDGTSFVRNGCNSVGGATLGDAIHPLALRALAEWVQSGGFDASREPDDNTERFEEWVAQHPEHRAWLALTEVSLFDPDDRRAPLFMLLASLSGKTIVESLHAAFELDPIIGIGVLQTLSPDASEMRALMEEILTGALPLPDEVHASRVLAAELSRDLFESDPDEAFALAVRAIEWDYARGENEAEVGTAVLDLLTTVAMHAPEQARSLEERVRPTSHLLEDYLHYAYTPVEGFELGTKSGTRLASMQGTSIPDRWVLTDRLRDTRNPLHARAAEALLTVATHDLDAAPEWRTRELCARVESIREDFEVIWGTHTSRYDDALPLALEKASAMLEGKISRDRFRSYLFSTDIARLTDLGDTISMREERHVSKLLDVIGGRSRIARQALDSWKAEAPVLDRPKFFENLSATLLRLFAIGYPEDGDAGHVPLSRRAFTKPEESAATSGPRPARSGTSQPLHSGINTGPDAEHPQVIGRVLTPLPAIHRHLITSVRGRYHHGTYAHPLATGPELRALLGRMEERIEGPFDTVKIELEGTSKLEALPFLAGAKRARNGIRLLTSGRPHVARNSDLTATAYFDEEPIQAPRWQLSYLVPKSPAGLSNASPEKVREQLPPGLHAPASPPYSLDDFPPMMQEVIRTARTMDVAWRRAEYLQQEIGRLYRYDSSFTLRANWRHFKQGIPYGSEAPNHHLKMIHAEGDAHALGKGQCPQFADLLQAACDLAGLDTMWADGILIRGETLTENDLHAQLLVFLLDGKGQPCLRPLCSLTARGYLFEAEEQEVSPTVARHRGGASTSDGLARLDTAPGIDWAGFFEGQVREMGAGDLTPEKRLQIAELIDETCRRFLSITPAAHTPSINQRLLDSYGALLSPFIADAVAETLETSGSDFDVDQIRVTRSLLARAREERERNDRLWLGDYTDAVAEP